MNVLLVNTLYHPNVLGGAERSVQLLAEGLAAMNHRVSVVSCSTNADDSSGNVNDVTVHYVRPRNVYSAPTGNGNALLKPLWHALDSYNPFMASALGQRIDQHRPDIVHTNTVGGFSVAAWRAAAKRRIPVVHTLRDYYLICPRTTMFRGNRSCVAPCADCRVYNWPRRLASSLVGSVVGISEFLLNAHLSRHYFPNATIKTVIRNACHAPSPPPPPGPGLRPDRIVLGYLGRLDPSKGIAEFLEAARQLPADRFEVAVAGKGDAAYDDMLRTRFAADNIRFLGFARPEEFFRQIHLLVVPSLWNEPLGRIVLEAHSNEIPVVATRRGGLPELVDEGKTGLLYDPDRPGELLDILRRTTPEDCARMRSHCTGKAAEYSPEYIASQYVEVYQKSIHECAAR